MHYEATYYIQWKQEQQNNIHVPKNNYNKPLIYW